MNFIKYIVFLFAGIAVAQPKFTIKGHFNTVSSKEITLKGYDGLNDITLGNTITDGNGNFAITYPADYRGAARLEVAKGKKVIVLLNHENFEMEWEDLSNTKNLKFTNSVENETLDQGQSLYQNTQEKKSALTLLLPLYSNEPQKSQFFKTELDGLNSVMVDHLKKIGDNTYAAYYLKMKTFISDFQLSLKRYPERTATLVNEFNTLDFSDERLLHSGLYDELLQVYVTVVMNRENKYEQFKQGTDAILRSLKSKPELKQNIAEFLFNIFEKKSLFEASEYIALSMLNDDSCPLDVKHKALFEQYRKMANGKVAPDIVFENAQKSHLYDLKNRYKLVVFGASWCQKCIDEIPKLKAFYQDWKKKYDLEIVLVSLDKQQTNYNDFVKNFPWISTCDYLGWESKAVTDYSVFGTPTMYLLDAQHTIKVKPISAEQINAWLELHK